AQPTTPQPPAQPTTPQPPAQPATPSLACTVAKDCYVYFREKRCHFGEPIAIPRSQRMDARSLYPSSMADVMVACAMPDPVEEHKALARWTATCTKNLCALVDNGPQKDLFGR
ncbi:MAG: hypothetical protein KDA24_23830, partial [Deltaproteobacteria bacterium]|nr:hypothetical protein [Deltaproteobacteria bacterium]